jgi:gliding motility-associated-like protein
MKKVLLYSLMMVPAFVLAQPTMVLMSDGNASTCNGTLFDTGGQGGAGYQNGENYTLVICPDVPGDVITLDFLSFALSTQNTATPPANNMDNMAIYDGNSTAAPSLGSYTGNQLQGLIVTCTSLNSSGCLTLVFNSNSAGTGVFAATITCSTPCQRPTVVMNAPTVANNPVRICDGETVNFNGSGSFAAPGFNIVDYIWNWGDGTTDTLATGVTSHTFATGAGEYLVNLFLIDDNNCISTNLETIKVQVGTEPTFTGTTADVLTCLGETVCLDGVVNSTLYTGQPINSLGGATYLPDNVGQCFTATLDFQGFLPGQTLTNINQLLNICVSMEHSYMGDLVCTIYCPNGQSVITHQQNGGSTNIGDPNQLDDPNLPGTCWNYCWSPTATNGTWVDNAAWGPTPNTVINSSGVASLAPGTYESLNPMSSLVGCPLNGTWTIEFCDLWGADDGFVCDWSIAFDPALYPAITTFEPVYGPNCDSTSWTASTPQAASFISSTTPDCNQICITPTAYGSFDYVYTVSDNFGCSYDTTITVVVNPGPTVDAGPDIVTCSGTPAQLNATPSGGILPAPGCLYTIMMYDTFGDGWNNFYLNVSINGGPPTPYTMNTGSQSSATFTILDGDVITLSTTSGFWDSEVTYEILDCQGNLLYTDGVMVNGFGPTIGANVTTFNAVNPTPPNYNYVWTPATGLSNPNIANPTATISSNMTYVVTVYETGHQLCGSTDTINVTIDPSVYAGEDSTNTLCFNDPAFDMFTYLGGTPAITGSWFDSAGNPISNMFDPATQVSGSYFYVVPSAGICPADTAEIQVTVLPPGAPGCGCNLNPVPAVGNVSCFAACDGDISVPANANQWSIDGGLTFQNNGNFASLCAGNYSIIVADTFFGPACQTTVNLVVTEPAVLTVDVTSVDAVCFGECNGSITATVSGGTTPYQYGWSNGSGTPSIQNLCAGTFSITLTDANGCTDDTTGIVINQNPQVTLDNLVAVDETCFGLCDGSIDVDATNAVEYSINGGTTFGASDVFTGLCVGLYPVVVQDADGCQDAQTITVSGPPEVIAGFTILPEEASVLEPEFTFTNTSMNAISYQWNFGGLDSTNTTDAAYTFPDQPGTVSVCLTATNANGCADTFCAEVVIYDILIIYVPNSFSPNNDGFNDLFYPIVSGYEPGSFKMQIFDRWGEKLFESTDPLTTWDGVYRGFPVKEDVYVWRIDSESSHTGAYRQVNGHVTVIR